MEAICKNKTEETEIYMASETVAFTLHNNEWFELVYSNTFLLLSPQSDIFIRLSDKFSNWPIRIKFQPLRSDYGTVTSDINDIGDITVNLFGFHSTGGTENNEPLILTSKNGKQILYCKFKSYANLPYDNNRMLIVTIWKKPEAKV